MAVAHLLKLIQLIVVVGFLCERKNALVQKGRYFPSVIWDNFNKLLTCKCNWMNAVKMGRYDQIALLCPVPGLVPNMRLGKHLPSQRMNYNIFVRPWKLTTNNWSELEELLNNGSFCDPLHSDTVTKKACKYDADDKGSSHHRIDVSGQSHGTVQVFFSNADKGLESELTSKKKQCTMVFIVEVTYNENPSHNWPYAKCFEPATNSDCENITKQCGRDCHEPQSTTTSSTITSRATKEPVEDTKPTPTPTSTGAGCVTDKGTKPKPTSTGAGRVTDKEPTTTRILSPTFDARGSESTNDRFQIVPFIVGLVVGIFVIGSIWLISIVYNRKKTRMCNYTKKVHAGKEDKKTNGGFRNEAYTSTLSKEQCQESPVVYENVELKDRQQVTVSETSGFPNGVCPSAPPREQCQKCPTEHYHDQNEELLKPDGFIEKLS